MEKRRTLTYCLVESKENTNNIFVSTTYFNKHIPNFQFSNRNIVNTCNNSQIY